VGAERRAARNQGRPATSGIEGEQGSAPTCPRPRSSRETRPPAKEAGEIIEDRNNRPRTVEKIVLPGLRGKGAGCRAGNSSPNVSSTTRAKFQTRNSSQARVPPKAAKLAADRQGVPRPYRPVAKASPDEPSASLARQVLRVRRVPVHVPKRPRMALASPWST